jgi:hypothetical protein
MTGGSGAKDAPHTLNEEERAPGEDVLSGLGELERRELLTWVGEHLPEVRRTAVGQRPVYWILGIGFVLSMAAYVGGYALRSSVTTEPLRFVGDLLYTLGLGTLDRCRRGRVPPGPSGGKAASIQAGARCLRGRAA